MTISAIHILHNVFTWPVFKWIIKCVALAAIYFIMGSTFYFFNITKSEWPSFEEVMLGLEWHFRHS